MGKWPCDSEMYLVMVNSKTCLQAQFSFMLSALKFCSCTFGFGCTHDILNVILRHPSIQIVVVHVMSFDSYELRMRLPQSHFQQFWTKATKFCVVYFAAAGWQNNTAVEYRYVQEVEESFLSTSVFSDCMNNYWLFCPLCWHWPCANCSL